MARAADQHTPREWNLDDYHRLVRITLGCGINVALCEMERRIVSGQLLLRCQEFDADDNLKDNAVEVDRFDFLSNYTLQLDRDDRVKVVTRKPEGLLPGGINTITKFDESGAAVRIGPGRVMDGYYTVVERPPRRPASQDERQDPSPSEKTKETVESRLINLMQERQLKSGMLPREVLKAVKQPYKHKYHDEPSQSAVSRAYKKYLATKRRAE